MLLRNLDFGAPSAEIVATRLPAISPPAGKILLVVGSLYKPYAKKLRAAQRKWLQNKNSLLGANIWGNISAILRFHQNLKIPDDFRRLTVSQVCGLMTKTLALLELSLYEVYGAPALTHRNLDILTPV